MFEEDGDYIDFLDAHQDNLYMKLPQHSADHLTILDMANKTYFITIPVSLRLDFQDHNYYTHLQHIHRHFNELNITTPPPSEIVVAQQSTEEYEENAAADSLQDITLPTAEEIGRDLGFVGE